MEMEPEKKAQPQPDIYQIQGYEIMTKTVTASGTSARIWLPPRWIGTRVKVVRIDPIPGEEGITEVNEVNENPVPGTITIENPVPETLTWILVKNGKEVVKVVDQPFEDLANNQECRYLLDWIIPEEHAEYAVWHGEWDSEGFTYTVGDDWYMVKYYVKNVRECW